jgi:VanZ family protein
MRRWISAWLPVAGLCAVIFALSSVPNLRFFYESWLDFVVRKSGHMAEFGLLAWLTFRGFTMTTDWSLGRRFWAALLFTFLYACSDEMHQRFVSGRAGQPKDVLIDTAGAYIALILRRRTSESRRSA